MNLTFTPQIAEVNCKEWNIDQKAFVHEPTAAEYAMYENISAKLHLRGIDDAERREVYARIGVLFCRDGDGKRLFTDDQLPMLMRANSKPLRRLAIKLGKLAQIDEDEAAELEKN